jgi:hypothetical protein
MKKTNIGIIALIGAALYFIFRNKFTSASASSLDKKYKTKVGSNLRTGPYITSRILKTYQSITDLKFVKSQTASDGVWYLVQELFPAGTISPSGENVGGNVMWTGWLRNDAITII